MHPRNHGYTAAMLDGEGCISIATYIQKVQKNGREYRYLNTQLAVSIFQTDERLMKWLMHHYGGRYSPRKPQKLGWKRGWSWSPSSKNLEKFLLTVIPYLLLKKEQTLLALEYVRLGKGKPGPKNDNAALHTSRRDLADRCSFLNSGESPEANTSNGIPFQSGLLKIESDLAGDSERAPVVTQAA